MRFVCTRSELQRGLQIAIQAASNQSPLQIYRNVLMQAADNQLKLMTFNGEVGFRVTVPVRVEQAGDATVPARLLADVVGNLPDADVVLQLGERDTVLVQCQKSEFLLSGEPADQFPLLPEVNTTTRLNMPAPILREIIHQTSFSVAHDESRPALTGISLSIKNGKIEAASTDTHRLSIREFSIPDFEGEAQVILPERAIQQFVKVIPPDAEDNVTIQLSNRQAHFEYRDVAVVSKLIEGQFPNYERVVPTSYEKLLVLDRDAFLRAVKRVSVIANKETSKRLVLRSGDGVLKLSAEVGGVGHAREELDLPEAVEGDDIELAFNADYLLEVLGELKSKNVRLEVSGKLTPCVIRAEDNAEYRYILMPMQMA